MLTIKQVENALESQSYSPRILVAIENEEGEITAIYETTRMAPVYGESKLSGTSGFSGEILIFAKGKNLKEKSEEEQQRAPEPQKQKQSRSLAGLWKDTQGLFV